MEARTIPDQCGVDVGSQGARKLFQELVDHGGVQHRRENGFGLAGLGTRRSDYPQVIILGLPHRRRPRSALSPHASKRSLLTESAFVLKDDDDLLLGMLSLNPSQFYRDFF